MQEILQIKEKSPPKETVDILSPAKNIKVKNLFGENEENMDPLSTLTKKSVKTKKSVVDPLAFLNGDINQSKKNMNKKVSLFNEEEKPENDLKDSLFQLPKRNANIKKLSFLDENEEDDPLTMIKKNATVVNKENKVKLSIILNY